MAVEESRDEMIEEVREGTMYPRLQRPFMADADRLLFVCSTASDADGIAGYRLDGDSGSLTDASSTEIGYPTYLAAHPDGDALYAANRVDGGSVSAFAVDPRSGELRPLNDRSSGGAGPCYVSVDDGGRYVFVANYDAGSVSTLPIREDRSIGDPTVVRHEGSGPVARRQDDPHPHAIGPGPSNRFAYAPDLGTDEVVAYHIDADGGALRRDDDATAEMPPGSGPRHFEFDPSGRYCYVVGELDSTVNVLERDPESGALDPVRRVDSVPDGAAVDTDNAPADVHVHPTGRWVYVSNRGHDSVVAFEASGDDLRPVEVVPTRGENPRDVALDPSGAHLVAANRNSGSVVGFAVDSGTGGLTPTGSRVELPKPTCACFVE